MDLKLEIKTDENKDAVYSNQDVLKINGSENAVNLNEKKMDNFDAVEGNLSSTMDRKRVEFSENSNLNLIGKNSKIFNANGGSLEEFPLENVGKVTTIEVPKGEVNGILDDTEVDVRLENDEPSIELSGLKSKRKLNRGDTLPNLKKSLAKATNQASTLFRNIKPPKFKTADAAGRSNSLKLDFQKQEIEIIKNTNTIRMLSKAEMKESFKKMKSSIRPKPTLVRNKTMPSNNRYLRTEQSTNGDEVSIHSDSFIEGDLMSDRSKYTVKRSPPPRPETGPSEDIISPVSTGQVNAENEFKANLSDLNPTQFLHSSHYNSQTLDPRGNKTEIDNTTKINNYLDKIRAKIAEGSNRVATMKPKTPKELVVLDRQEVYSFSLKNKSLTRRHTTLNQANTMIQPRVARPKLQETLRYVNDPSNANTLNLKTFTLDRSNTYDNGYERSMTIKGDGFQNSPIISAKMGSTLNQSANELIDTTYFPIDTSYEIEMRGSPFYGEKLKKNLPKDMLKREAMETTNQFLEYNQNMKKSDEASKSNAKDSDVKHLEAYMKASDNLHDAELRPEYLTFFTGYSTINPRKWTNRGSIKDWLELNLFKNHENGLDYIKIPRNMKLENTVAYPLVSVDTMLKNWLEKNSALPENLDQFKTPQQQDLLHTLSYMSTLDDLTNCIDASEIIRITVGLAILLSLDYCTKTYAEFNISSDPTKILLVGAPTNCLVIFRLSKPRKEPITPKELVDNFANIFELIHIEKKDTLEEMINELIACAHISLHQEMQDQAEFSLKLLKCVSPPDWTAVCMARIGLHKLDKSN